MKRIVLIVLFLIFLNGAKSFSWAFAQYPKNTVSQQGEDNFTIDASPASRMKIISERARLRQEANLLVKRGKLEEAIVRYRESMAPALMLREGDKSHALVRILRIYILQGNLELAQKTFEEVYVLNPKKTSYINEKSKIDALLKAQSMQSKQSIYEYIAFAKEKNKLVLPPNQHNTFTPSIASDIIQLYDYTGDYDSGIQFVDQILNTSKPSHGFREDYLKVREAFLQDRAEGRKSCFETQVPGEACVGSATQVLIQSDHLPW